MECSRHWSLPVRIARTMSSHVSPNSSCAVLWLRVAPLRRHSESRSSIASGCASLTLPYEGRGLPAIRLGYFGMRAALGTVGKAGEIDRVRLVVHVGLETVIVPVFPGWPIFHVA